MIKLPLRHSISDQITRAASNCLKIACTQHFPLVPLGDLGQILSGNTPDTTNPDLWSGDTVWITPKDLGRPRNIEVTNSERHISEPTSSSSVLPTGTVLLSSRAPIGHLGIAAVPLCTNQGFKNIICSNTLNNRYLFHILRASVEELEALGRGNTFKEIPAKVVKEFRVPLPPREIQDAVASFLDVVYMRQNGEKIGLPALPAPLSEQRRIVGHIEELAGKIEEARGLRREAVAEADTLAIAATRFVLDRIDNQSKLGDRQNCKVLCGQHLTPEEQSKDGLPYITGPADFGKRIAKPTRFASVAKTVCLPGDVLVTVKGAGVGKVNLAPATPTVIGRQLFAIRPSPEVLDQTFLWFVLQYKLSDIRDAITATTVPGIGRSDVEAITVPLPPLPEQERIVAYLDGLQAKVDALKALQGETEKELAALLPSVLDRAFSGRL